MRRPTRSDAIALLLPGRAPLDVAAFRGWFAARVAAGEPFQHVRAVVSEGAAGVSVLLEARGRSPWRAARRAADAAAAVEAWDRTSAAEQRALDIDALDARADELAASIRTLQVAGATLASEDVAAQVAERDATLRRRAALAAVDPASPTAGAPHHTAEASRDAVAQLRARLFALTPLVSTRVFLITAHPGVRGKSAVACRLAEALALHGSRTLLVDAALSAPMLADRYLGDPRQVDPAEGRGVASTLSWLEDPEGDHRVATIDVAPRVTFDLVPQTRPIWLAPGTTEAFYRGLAMVLERWDGYDAIVIDAPELTPRGDVAWIAAYVTGAVLVVVPSAASDPVVARRAQRALGAPLLGVVVSDPTPAGMARPKQALFVA